MFITLEGIDGAGKTTQANLLSAWIRERGRRVLLTREPGGSALGRELRAILLEKKALALSLEAEIFLYLADRVQHVTEVLQPALLEGTWVVGDRYLDSTMAYQGYGMGADLEALLKMNRWACRGIYPDLTILLDLDPRRGAARRSSGAETTALRSRSSGAEAALPRVSLLGAEAAAGKIRPTPPEAAPSPVRRSGEEDRVEGRGIDYLTRVREGFLALAAGEPERVKVVDASAEPATVHRAILQFLAARKVWKVWEGWDGREGWEGREGGGPA